MTGPQPPFASRASATDPAVPSGPTIRTALPDRGAAPLPVIANYRVLRWLGGGGMGDVYEVIDERLDHRLALKVIRPDRLDPTFRERFRQEVKAMARLHHPHVARFYEYHEAGGCPYFTMEFFPGGTLADHRDEFRADPPAAARLLAKVADATDYLHRQGKVHRDLKPSNILFNSAGEPVVGDFGLVKDVTDPGSAVPTAPPPAPAVSTPVAATDETRTAAGPADPAAVTRTGGIVGTAAYMSPEQARGDRLAVGPAADVWALGVILYELVLGHRPADSDDPAGPLAPLARLDPGLGRVVGRCLAPEPGARYTSAAELAADLRRWADPGTAPSSAWRQSPWRFAPAAALLIGAAALVYFAIRSPGEPAPEELRQRVRERLKAGETVTLIDGNGNAEPVFRLVVGDAVSKAGRDPDGWWGLHSPDVAMAEFLDDPGVPALTVSARVRGEWAVQAGPPTAGLYVAHRRVTDPAGLWDFQLEHGFRESVTNYVMAGQPLPAPAKPAPKSRTYRPKSVQAKGDADGERFVRLHGREASGAADVPWPLAPPQAFGADRPTAGGPWRAVEIRTDGKTFVATWDENPPVTLGAIPDAEVGRVQRYLQAPPDPPLTFTARGGLGVFVHGGSAAVRDLKVVPRTDPGLAPHH